MTSFKQPHLAASDCEDPPQSPEGTAALKQPFNQSPDSQDASGGFCETPQKNKDSQDEGDTSVPPRKPSGSKGNTGQEVQEPLLVRLLEESSCDGTVQQEIQDVELIPWKTLYNQYLEKADHASQTVGVILQRYGLTKEHHQCMLGFIRCAANVRSCRCRDPTAALACLKRHSLFPKAEICIAKNLPDLDGRKEKPAYVRAVTAAIVLFAGGVRDIQELVRCLQRPSSTMSLMDALEMLYSTATLLYAMRENEVWISNRFHYNVFYCLHHLEKSPDNMPAINDLELSSSNGDLGSVLRPTSEQQQILNHELKPRERVIIEGFAGTGKTSTLIQYARKWSELNFLYLVFNKTMAQKALQVFPANVTCKTIHSLAYAKVGREYENKFIPDLLTDEVRSVLSNPETSATKVVQTLKAFFASADDAITVEHTGYGENVEECKKQIIVEEAKQIWTKMKAPGPTTEMAHRMTHDGYLKLWQLRKPSLSKYDAILVDQAEDCTPAMMNVVLSQQCAVILAGDLHQQIYTFRGSDNTAFDVPHSHVFYLTQSFRFGYEIAYVGAILLDVSQKVRKVLVGNNKGSDASVDGKVACLSWTNKSIFEKAVSITSGDLPAKIHFLGGIKAVGLDIIEDLWKVLDPDCDFSQMDFLYSIQCSSLSRSLSLSSGVEEGLASIKDYAEKAEDKQLEIKIGIVEKYRERIPELVKRIRKCHVSNPENADYVLGTVHKAKGLEFDTVQIDDDLMSNSSLARLRLNQIGIPKDEWNLLYLAVTRAKKCLTLPRFFADILKAAKEYCVRFELATELSSTTPLVCSEDSCRSAIPADSVLIPKRINFPYMDGAENPEGFLCPSCASCQLGPVAQLSGSSRIEVPAVVHILLEDF
ncbi:F-box DNA helicase 1-like isoform X2 [Ahaetulla prasina]|uniref:F-box DNA helicase 1-like isoform X2 n=1 Tax=Ahaetulla prasina TaxID=499056 RepID=UPI002648A0A4|nr:F-box DNA helicase 1-like isoform X2 [Ahaetulla prasina]